MLPCSYFAPIHRPRRVPAHDPRGLHLSERKRKRDDDDEDSGRLAANQFSRDEQTPSDESFLSGISAAVLPSMRSIARGEPGRNEASILGVEPPRASSRQPVKPKQSLPRGVIGKGLKELQPPLLSARRYPSSKVRGSNESSRYGARRRHVGVLTTIMHRSLLQHDYLRAGRAWSMILRTELDGHSMDPRNGQRWGLGAEILLRQQTDLSNQVGLTKEREVNTAEISDQYLSTEGFEKAKEYYDRLSLQYPYNKVYPAASSPLDFRMAMFSLWIYASTDQQSLDADGNQAVHPSDHELTEDSPKEASRRAIEISDRLDELLSSPPYSDTERYRRLQRMVTLWREDLELVAPSEEPDTGNGASQETDNSSAAGDPLSNEH